MSRKIKLVVALAISFLLPTSIWGAILTGTGSSDVTGENIYWYLGYPSIVLASVFLTWLIHSYWWVWPSLMLFVQFAIIVSWPTPGEKNLIPVAVVFYLIYAIPMLFASGLTARFVRRRLAISDDLVSEK